jgi:hypothetical protein
LVAGMPLLTELQNHFWVASSTKMAPLTGLELPSLVRVVTIRRGGGL